MKVMVSATYKDGKRISEQYAIIPGEKIAELLVKNRNIVLNEEDKKNS